MTRIADLIGELLAAIFIAVIETAGRVAGRRINAAATNPDDPDESDAEAASPVADYRSRA